MDDPIGAKSVTAPATVSGEDLGTLGHWVTGKAAWILRPASQETCHTQTTGQSRPETNGSPRRVFMTARTNSLSLSISQRIAAGLALLFVGLSLTYAVGFSSLAVAHNTAHDTRHAIGFPCH